MAQRGAAGDQPTSGAWRAPGAANVAAPAAIAAATRGGPTKRAYRYDTFISYSHEDERELQIANAVEQALEQLGKPWRKRRALNVFLDQHDLVADAGLKRELHDAIESSRFFVFLASPASADPTSWCSHEIVHWFDSRGAEAADNMLFVLTGGELRFVQPGDDVVDFERSTAAPAVLRGRLEMEPFYVDLRWPEDEVHGLDIHRDLAFRQAMTKLAAPVHGCEAEELDSQDLHEYKKSRRFRRRAVVGMAGVTVLALALAGLAVNRQNEATSQSRRSSSRALANEALANAASEHDLALLQALEAVRLADTPDAWGSLVGVLSEPSRFQQRSMGVHQAPVAAIDTDDTGTLAATGDLAGKVVVWDVVAGEQVRPATAREFPQPLDLGGPVDHVALFRRGGTTVVQGVTDDGSSAEWDADTGAPLAQHGVEDVLSATAVTDDGTLMAGAADRDGNGDADRIVLYRDGKAEIGPDVNEDEDVEHLVFGPAGKTLAWSQGQTVHLWDLTGPAQPIGEPFSTPVLSLAFSGDGRMLAVGEEEGNIWLVDLDHREEPAGEVEPRPTSPPRALTFSPGGSVADGYTLASAHRNGQVQVWSVLGTLGYLDDTLLGHNDEATAIAVGASGQIVSAGYDGQVLWWGDTPLAGLGEFLPAGGDQHEADVTHVAFVDEEAIVSRDADGQIILTDLASGTGERVDEIEGGLITAVDAAAEVLALGGADGSIVVLERPTDEDSEEFSLSGEYDSEELLDSDESLLLDVSDDGTGLVSVASNTVIVWDLEERAVRSRPDLPDDVEVWSVLFGEHERVWIGGLDTGDGEGVVFEVDAASGSLEDPIGVGTEGVSALALSADGRTLASGGADRRIRLWDAASHEASGGGDLVGHRDVVSGLAFTSDGQNLISIDVDLVVNYWDLADRRRVASLHGPGDGINDLALSADGQSLVVASEDDFVYLWPVDKRAWIDRACEMAGRNLTEQEWRLYGHGPQRRLCDENGGVGPSVDWSGRLDG